MSKTTPEEAEALARKHGGDCDSHDGDAVFHNMVQLAALIDEVRGVDAEPVAFVDGDDASRRIIWGKNIAAFDFPIGTELYTRPAPSQPAAPVELPVAWTPGPNEFKDWCSRWFGPDSDDDYLAKAVFNLPLMAQKFETRANTPPVPALPVEALRTLAKELDGELHSGAKWTKAQHTCNSVSGALLDIANKLSDAQAAIKAGRKAS